MEPKPPPAEQRAHDRFGVAMRVTIEGEEGRTHDVSAEGILLETEARPPVGSVVSLGLSFRAQGSDHRVGCYGRVVRVERHGDRYNVAVKLSKPLLE